MDMLFDPYADGPFKAGTRSAALTKSRPEPGLTPLEFGGAAPAAREPSHQEQGQYSPGQQEHGHYEQGQGRHEAAGGAAGGWARPHLPDAGALLEGLNPQQEEAVKHAGSALLIVAGAGSGKTRVLSNRIAYLIATKRAHHGEILAITFTNKAAAEMRERIEALVGGRAKAMWISTFHSSCVRILRQEAASVGLKSNFSIY